MDNYEICKRILIDTGINKVPIDYNHVKKEVLVHHLKEAKELESGLLVLEGKKKTSDKVVIDQEIVPVNFNEMLNMLDEGNRMQYDQTFNPNGYIMLVRRGALGMKKEIVENGRKKELNLTIGLIVNNLPSMENLSRKPGSIYFMKGEELIPPFNLVRSLERITEEFCRRYPSLSFYYPFSPKFKYK